MRKFLLGSTAIVTAAAFASPASAAEKIELGLRGYAQFGLAGIISEPDDPVFFEGIPVEGNSMVFGSDSEVHFRGKTTLDNGLTVSFRAELELEDDAEVDDDSDTIDEVYVQFDGGFGRLQFGMQDGVGDQMIISAPNVFSQFTISSIDMNPFEMYTASDLDSAPRDILGESSYLDTSPDFTADTTKIIYFTPRVYGFQLGVSYAPNACRNDTGLDVNVREGADADPIFSCGNSDAFGSNYWEVAGNFEHEFNGFGLGASASYGSGGENPFFLGLDDNPSEWHVGGEMFFNMGSGKLILGGAYKKTDNLTADNTPDVFSESKHYDVGATYAVGPWEIGGTYGNAKSEDRFSLLNEEELTLIIGGVSYKMGPGVKLGLGVIHGDAEVTDRFFLEGVVVDIEEADATAVFSELDLRF